MELLHLKVSDLNDASALRVGQKITILGEVRVEGGKGPDAGSVVRKDEIKFELTRLNAETVTFRHITK